MTDPIDTKARELLGKALRDLGLHEDAYHVGCGADLDRNDQAAINAISSALRAAPEGYVLVPVEPTEKMVWDGWCAEERTGDVEDIWAAMIAARPGEGA